jgi:hypothetical protein
MTINTTFISPLFTKCSSIIRNFDAIYNRDCNLQAFNLIWLNYLKPPHFIWLTFYNKTLLLVFYSCSRQYRFISTRLLLLNHLQIYLFSIGSFEILQYIDNQTRYRRGTYSVQRKVASSSVPTLSKRNCHQIGWLGGLLSTASSCSFWSQWRGPR